MILNPFHLFSKGLLLITAFSACLFAAPIRYTVTNLTASGGDPVFSIATNVTFTNLALRENFADSTSSLITLYDFNNTARTSLDTATVDLNSLTLNTVDPTHGNLTSAVLTGLFSQTTLSIVNTFGGSSTSVQVLPNFSATLPLNSSSVNITATTSAGASYAAGTLESSLANTPVPEPSSYGIVGLGLVALCLAVRRNLQA